LEINILFFTDAKFEYMAKCLIESLDIQKVDAKFLYYTIGFDSNLNHPNLVKKRWQTDISKPRFEFYKPILLLDALNYYDNVVFLDSDIIVGKRFDLSKFYHEYNYPLASIGNWDKPYSFVIHDGKEMRFDEHKLMNYISVTSKSMSYVYSCFMSVNRKCIDFLKEWEEFCSNFYLLENRQSFYPFQDETSFNVLLWKRGCTKNYGRIYLNTLYFDPLEFVEEKEGFKGNVYSVPEQFVDNSSNVVFYHGMKNEIELESSLNYLRLKVEEKEDE